MGVPTSTSYNKNKREGFILSESDVHSVHKSDMNSSVLTLLAHPVITRGGEGGISDGGWRWESNKRGFCKKANGKLGHGYDYISIK